ncbi:GrpB family protein [Planococcus lenghuensis]|uniref:GrpB family protein n=1 Tax=Planococcus lenghuensis TaxID=2213202 RepID=UPI002FC31847
MEVLPYDPRWKSRFSEEAEALRVVLGDQCLAVHHIGSTAVEGLAAKPVIDLMPTVKDIHEIDKLNRQFESLGYEVKGENGIPGRRYLQKGGDARTHHVHIYEAGSPEIRRHLAFRDYLRKHPAEAEVYGNLKLQLAAAFPWSIEQYIAGKEAVATSIEKRALAEFGGEKHFMD